MGDFPPPFQPLFRVEQFDLMRPDGSIVNVTVIMLPGDQKADQAAQIIFPQIGQSEPPSSMGERNVNPVGRNDRANETISPNPGKAPVTNPMPAPTGKIYVPENLDKILISFVALSVAKHKTVPHKDHITPPAKEIKEPEVIQPKPHAEMMRLEPKAQTEQQGQKGSQQGQAQREPMPDASLFIKGAKNQELSQAQQMFQAQEHLEGQIVQPGTPQVTPKPAQEGHPQGTAPQIAATPSQPNASQMGTPQNFQIPLNPALTINQPNAPAEKPQCMPQIAAAQAATSVADAQKMPVIAPVVPVDPSSKPLPAESRVDPVQAVAKIAEVHGNQAKPRSDAVVPQERQDNQANPTAQNRDDPKIAFRLPFMQDLQTAREGILKQIQRSNGSYRLDHDGQRLGDVILMMVTAVLCGSRTLTEIFRFLDARRTFFSAWLGLKQGTPSLRMLWWLLHRLNPETFQELVNQALAGKNSFVYQIQVWDSDRGLILGELLPLIKSSKPPLAREMLHHLDLTKAAVTADGVTLDPEIARRITQKGGAYIMAIRQSHGPIYDIIQGHFEDTSHKKEIHHEAIEQKGHSEQREISVSRNLAFLEGHGLWNEIQTAVRLLSDLITERRRQNDKRYYLSSLNLKADAMAANIRLLSLVEQRVEWLLDCDFARSKEALAVEHGWKNMEALLKTSWMLLEKETSVKGSFEVKRQKARQDNAYLRKLITR